jgi:hypothetical protein
MYQVRQDGQDCDSDISLIGATIRAKSRATYAGKGKFTVMRLLFAPGREGKHLGEELAASYTWTGGKLIAWVR